METRVGPAGARLLVVRAMEYFCAAPDMDLTGPWLSACPSCSGLSIAVPVVVDGLCFLLVGLELFQDTGPLFLEGRHGSCPPPPPLALFWRLKCEFGACFGVCDLVLRPWLVKVPRPRFRRACGNALLN